MDVRGLGIAGQGGFDGGSDFARFLDIALTENANARRNGREDPLGFITLATTMLFTRILLLLSLAIATPLSAADSIRILSQNLNRLFDDIDDGNKEKVLSHARFRERVKAAAEKIGDQFELPEIIALQEVENQNLLQQIALEIQHRHGLRYQTALIPGQDISGIHASTSMLEISIHAL